MKNSQENEKNELEDLYSKLKPMIMDKDYVIIHYWKIQS